MKINVKGLEKTVWASPDAARALLERDFKVFVSYFFWVTKKKEFRWRKHLLKIADELLAVHRGDTTYLLINMPPRYGKTELVIKLFSAWCFAKNPKCEFIHLSYGDELALDNSSKVREIVKTAQFLHLWPECKTKSHRDGKGAWETRESGVFKASAAGGVITGFGAGSEDDCSTGEYVFSGAILIDDPLKPDDARSDPKRESVNRRWDETIKSRRNSQRTPVIVIMQRVHEMDFCGMLLVDKEFNWRRVVMPAIINENTDSEQPLSEDKHTLKQLHAMRDKNKWHFSGQYQQDPSPLGGGMIKEEWWPYYLDYNDVYNRCTLLFMTADTAYTEDSANDPSVIQFWGCEGAKRMYLLGQIRGWWEFPELLSNSSKFWKRHTQDPTGRAPRWFFVEAKASGKSLVQTLRKNGIKGAQDWKPKDWNFPDDKVGRVNESTWGIMNGDVWLPDESIAPWVTGFVQEHTRFTNNDTHLYDDQVDTMTMAYSIWRRYGGGGGTESDG